MFVRKNSYEKTKLILFDQRKYIIPNHQRKVFMTPKKKSIKKQFRVLILKFLLNVF